MKTLLKLFLFLLVSSNCFAQLWIVDPLEALYPDTNNLQSYSEKWQSDIAQGGIADVHVVVKLPVGTKFDINAEINGNTVEISQLLAVPVEQNTGIDSRTEQYINKVNPHVIRRAPFHIYEVIKPLEDNKVVTTQNYTAFRIAIDSKQYPINNSAKVKVEVVLADKILKGIFQINVLDVVLPKVEESDFFYTNWFNLTRMEEQHDLVRWSSDWFLMLDKYAEIMAHGRQNSITIPHELFQYKNEEFFLDEDKLLQFINTFRKHGFKFFEAPHLLNRGDNDDWGDPELKVALSKKRYYKEHGKNDIEVLIKLIKSFTSKHNLTENWLQHISDEPTAVQADCYKDVARQIKRIYPEILIMEATNARDQLVGGIDIWCPIIDDFQENEAFFREREKNGEKVLVYTCLVPGGPWLNRTLDMEKLRQVYFGWGASHYNTGGYLHWGLNQYYSNPFEQSVVKHPSPGAGANNFLPAGDTHIIYPGENGPLSSIRFEAHRMGSEDFDLLSKLKIENPSLHKKLIKKLFKSYTDYNLSIKEYRKTKRKLLKSIKG